MKKALLSFFILSFATSKIFAGWAHYTHINYIKEAVRILPHFDYEMCLYYKDHLIEGAVEGEIHYKFITAGKYPLWMSELTEEEITFLNGIPINDLNVNSAAVFFAKRFESLRENLDLLDKPYSRIMFELGYFLHSINNSLIPEYQGGKSPWQQAGSKTDSIDIKTLKIEMISNLEEWLLKTLEENLKLRAEWTKASEDEIKEEFLRIAAKAHERNIYNTASLIEYVLNDTFGPSDERLRKIIAEKHAKHFKSNGGRKPGI